MTTQSTVTIATLTVSQFLAQINELIAGIYTIEGEVSQYRVSNNKWIFFDLKDENSVLSCFSTVYMMRTPLEDGMRVRVSGYPKVYEKQGRFSFTVQKMDLVGEGTLQRAYQLLKMKLTTEGLFDLARKRLLPPLPQRLGVIASRDSAAWGDFKRIINNRWGGLEITLRHALVQGESAVQDIIAAFGEFNEAPDPPDVLVLIRGGGSLEDLQAFNSEEVVRAIARSRVPVLVGVGHERDETLADFVADVRASTPSNAAEILVPDKRDFVGQLQLKLDHLSQTLSHALAVREQRVHQAAFIISSRLEAPLVRGHQLVDRVSGLLVYLYRLFERQKDFVVSSERLFKNVDPWRVLKRGYSITRDERWNVIKSAEQVDIGERVMVELAKGTLYNEVMKKR